MNLVHISTYLSKKQFSFICLFISILSINIGQAQTRSEFAIEAGGIFNKLTYELSSEDASINHSDGASIGIGYSFYLKPQWAISIGGIYQHYQSEARFGILQGSYTATDIEGENFEFRYTATDYSEEQNLNVVHIPLTLQFQTEGDTKIYVRAGGQIGILLSSEYTSITERLSTSGYYPQYDAELFDPQFMGFGTYNNLKAPARELDWNTSFSAVLEAGVKREAGKNSHLYIGFFINYGLNTISNDNREEALVAYQTSKPDDFLFNSIFSTGNAKQARLQSFGVKLRYAFGGY
ncbi:outer membrane beta-barrel protein [Mesonia aquimarina]|uniref:outer membrane beta-barrel protein n=1 Tax=Mesonia aquimarina TaxID=1504967 RepID=UPI000EF5EF87|nr:outer membrane beta-barrel protein [Mesonia aquimarina]